ncbi:MAG: NAD-dependent epimerase/dehydratase family protein [Candidatus Rokubacteria bacterium]|nr:NAD-dependent epimerase/dehydratase family protein [Candidatus Rokubacteria bacterium]
MPILITGASGFVGRALVRELRSRGASLRCVVGPTARFLPADEGVQVVRRDLGAPLNLTHLFSGVDTVVHLAGASDGFDPARVTRVNYGSTFNLVEAACEVGIKRFLLLSLLGSAPEKSAPHAYSKWLAQETVRRSGLGFTILKSSLLMGAGDRFLTPLLERIASASILPVPGIGRVRLQPLWVGDAVRALLRCLEDPTSAGRSYVLCGPEAFSFRAVLERLMAWTKRRRALLPVPPPVFSRWAAGLPSHPIAIVGELARLRRDSVAAPDAICRTFGFPARGLEEVLEEFGAAQT